MNNQNNDFISFLNDARDIVASWPSWKQQGTDATKFQNEQPSANNEKIKSKNHRSRKVGS